MATPTIKTIKKLKSVGIFSDVNANSFEHEFKRHNLIYGFNGSGKTTLSRLLDSLSERGVSTSLESSAEFCFGLSDGSEPHNNSPSSPASRYVAVFNEDYIQRSLAWSLGTAEPIIFIGEEQADIAEQLERLEQDEQDQAYSENLSGNELSSSEREFANTCRDVARIIAEETGLGRNYNAAKLKFDYAEQLYGPELIVSDERRTKLRQIINQTNVPDKLAGSLKLSSLAEIIPAIDNTLTTTLAKLTIESLERRKDALHWVKEGLRFHEAERECLFCGSEIPFSRLDDLSIALEDGFQNLSASIREAHVNVRQFVQNCRSDRDMLSNIGDVLPQYRNEVSDIRKEIDQLLSEGESLGGDLQDHLNRKLSNPEIVIELALNAEAWDQALAEASSKLDRLKSKNNSDIEDFSSEQQKAQEKLKGHHLAHYDGAYREIAARVQDNSATFSTAKDIVKTTREKIRVLRGALRTHGPAAAQMNEILSGYLGHKEIQLVANEKGYQLSRKGSTAPRPLSEGEKTAVAFSHFLVTLNSEGRSPKDFIVVLDDPISSLDARAMTHAVALVQQRFEEPLQLFVLTHNLDFMREMKKWLQRRYDKDLAEFLFIQTSQSDGSRSSKIVKMPKLIREYESEYHYLYSLVKILADDPEKSELFAYLMPNAIRKVLDIFLAFKIPGNSGLSAKVSKLITDNADLDGARVKAMERVAQLESHSESIGDTTTFSAYTLEQLGDAAKTLLEVINIVDAQHKAAMDKLCKGITHA